LIYWETKEEELELEFATFELLEELAVLLFCTMLVALTLCTARPVELTAFGFDVLLCYSVELVVLFFCTFY